MGGALDRLRAAHAAADRAGVYRYRHDDDCPHWGCDDGCEGGEECQATDGAECKCSVAAAVELQAAIRQVLA